MQAEYFTRLFLFLLISGLGFRLWLEWRQISHIGARRSAVPEAFANKISLAGHQKASDYNMAKSRLAIFEMLVDALLLLVLTVGGGIAALHVIFNSHFPTLSPLWTGVMLIISLGLIGLLSGLPASIYRQFVIEESFGFNRMSGRLFVSDLGKQLLLSLLLGLPLIYGVLWLMGAMGEYWWLWAWLAWSAFNLLLLWLYPAVIAPWFNKFTQLEDDGVKSRVEELMKRCNFAMQGLFVMDASKRSSHGNAYFTGFGRVRRVVLFDTLLKYLNPEEIEAILAHELGHLKHKHIAKRLLMSLAASLFFLWMLSVLLDAHWFFAGLGAPLQADNALALALFFLAAPVFLTPLTPLFTYLSRLDEFEADRYAARQASGEALAQALIKLYEDNAATLTPDPLHSLYYDSHPPAVQRVARLRNNNLVGARA